MSECADQPPGRAERTSGSKEAGITTGEGSMEWATAQCFQANTCRSMLRKSRKRHAVAKKKKALENEMSIIFDNEKEPSVDRVEAVGVVAGHTTPDLQGTPDHHHHVASLHEEALRLGAILIHTFRLEEVGGELVLEAGLDQDLYHVHCPSRFQEPGHRLHDGRERLGMSDQDPALDQGRQ